MKRRTFDILLSGSGLIIAVILLVAGGLLVWANQFIGGQVHDQLAAQKIEFPAADSKEFENPDIAPIRKYAGKQLTTGAQAEAYANHYIAVHLDQIGGGKTYSELSDEARANPDDAELAGNVSDQGNPTLGIIENRHGVGGLAGVG